MRYISIMVFSLLFIITVVAQDTCSAFVEDALATVDTLCKATGRNELCYGNNTVSITTITGEELDFSQPGDITSILDIETIRTNPYAEPDEWGIALMRVQANIPDSLPGQNVTFLLFGDVNLSNAGSSSTTLFAKTTGKINVRKGPSTNFSIADSLQSGTTIELRGRNAAGDWVYFANEDGSGWVFASLLQIEGDVMQLDEVSVDFAASSAPKPMQAVYFSSGIGESSCNDVPQDGILIQTPDYEQAIELIVNDVEISLGSTIYVQAQAGGLMTIYVLGGFAFVSANGETVNVPEGAVTTIEIDENLQAASIPSKPEPYITAKLESAPVSTLDEEIGIAEPASQEEINAVNQVITGTWVGVDGDDSTITVVITSSGNGLYHVAWFDTATLPCNGGAAEGNTEGAIIDGVLAIQLTASCVSGDGGFGPVLIEYTYNETNDTLRESWLGGVVIITHSRQ